MLYFAYGSNLDCCQIVERCPSTVFLNTAELPRYRLAFTRFSKMQQCGVADVVEDPLCTVWGVLYEIGDEDVALLDRCEGFKPGRGWNAYWRRGATVITDSPRKPGVEVETYFATPQKNPPLPSKQYLGLIVRGARFWGFPADYVDGLSNTPTSRRLSD